MTFINEAEMSDRIGGDDLLRPALQNHFKCNILSSDDEDLSLLTNQLVNVYANDLDKKSLTLTFENDTNGNVAKLIHTLYNKTYQISIENIETILHDEISYTEAFTNCQMINVNWKYNYASSETVKYIVTFRFTHYSIK